MLQVIPLHLGGTHFTNLAIESFIGEEGNLSKSMLLVKIFCGLGTPIHRLWEDWNSIDVARQQVVNRRLCTHI